MGSALWLRGGSETQGTCPRTHAHRNRALLGPGAHVWLAPGTPHPGVLGTHPRVDSVMFICV